MMVLTLTSRTGIYRPRVSIYERVSILPAFTLQFNQLRQTIYSLKAVLKPGK